ALAELAHALVGESRLLSGLLQRGLGGLGLGLGGLGGDLGGLGCSTFCSASCAAVFAATASAFASSRSFRRFASSVSSICTRPMRVTLLCVVDVFACAE